MNKIGQTDRIFLFPPHMSGLEMEFIRQAFESNYIAPLGPMVDAFEKEFCEKTGIPYAVAVSSGTAAMHLAVRSLGIAPGDEVLVSNLTGKTRIRGMRVAVSMIVMV